MSRKVPPGFGGCSPLAALGCRNVSWWGVSRSQGARLSPDRYPGLASASDLVTGITEKCNPLSLVSPRASGRSPCSPLFWDRRFPKGDASPFPLAGTERFVRYILRRWIFKARAGLVRSILDEYSNERCRHCPSPFWAQVSVPPRLARRLALFVAWLAGRRPAPHFAWVAEPLIGAGWQRHWVAEIDCPD